MNLEDTELGKTHQAPKDKVMLPLMRETENKLTGAESSMVAGSGRSKLGTIGSTGIKFQSEKMKKF